MARTTLRSAAAKCFGGQLRERLHCSLHGFRDDTPAPKYSVCLLEKVGAVTVHGVSLDACHW